MVVKIAQKNYLQQKQVNIFHQVSQLQQTISSFKGIEKTHGLYMLKISWKKFVDLWKSNEMKLI